MKASSATARGGEAGFTLIETLIAIGVLAAGFLALAQIFTMGLANLAMAPFDIIAREKAVEAVESVYTARDARTLTWNQLRNDADGGVFLGWSSAGRCGRQRRFGQYG